MGECESKGNKNQTVPKNPGMKKPETLNPDYPLQELKSISKASKSVCKLIVPPNQLGSGFLILKEKKNFTA